MPLSGLRTQLRQEQSGGFSGGEHLEGMGGEKWRPTVQTTDGGPAVKGVRELGLELSEEEGVYSPAGDTTVWVPLGNGLPREKLREGGGMEDGPQKGWGWFQCPPGRLGPC